MTRTLRITSFVWLGMLLSFSGYVQAQDAPLGALPMQYNGSFAGETGTSRINGNVGYNYGELYGSRSWLVSTSYDQFIPAIRSGIGVMVSHGNSKGDISSSSGNSIYLAFAPKFSIKGKYTISPSLNFSYAGGYVKYDEGSYWDTIQPSYTGKYRSVTSQVGILFNANKFYAGYSMYLIDKFKRSSYTSSLNRGFHAYIQAGYTFERSATSKFSFTPQIVIRIMDEGKYVMPSNYDYRVRINLEAINLNFRYKQVIWGISDGFHVGWQNDHIRIMMSSRLQEIFSESSYSGNLSFRYIFNRNSANVIRY